MNRPFFVLSWFALSLIGLAVVNLAFVVFVVSLDVLVSAPPQVSAPTFVIAVILIIAIIGLLEKRTRRESRDSRYCDAHASSLANGSPASSRQLAFRSMLIIRRDLETSPRFVRDEKGIYETSI